MSMKCPKCGAKAQVTDTRPVKDNGTRRRYRCHGRNEHRWSTIEMLVTFDKWERSLKGSLENKMKQAETQRVQTALRAVLGLK